MAKKRHIVGIVLTVFAILTIAAGLVFYNEYQQVKAAKKLQINLVKIEIKEAGWTSITPEFTLAIYNPNKINTEIGDFNAKIYANEQEITNIQLKYMQIKAQETIQQKIPITINYLDLGFATIEAIQNKQMTWTIKGQYKMHLPFGITIPYNFEITKTFK